MKCVWKGMLFALGMIFSGRLHAQCHRVWMNTIWYTEEPGSIHILNIESEIIWEWCDDVIPGGGNQDNGGGGGAVVEPPAVTWSEKKRVHRTDMGHITSGQPAWVQTEANWKVSDENPAQVKEPYVTPLSAGVEMSATPISPSSTGPTDSIYIGYQFTWRIGSTTDDKSNVMKTGAHKWYLNCYDGYCNDDTIKR